VANRIRCEAELTFPIIGVDALGSGILNDSRLSAMGDAPPEGRSMFGDVGEERRSCASSDLLIRIPPPRGREPTPRGGDGNDEPFAGDTPRDMCVV
jgi:hypothetical protein